MVPLPSLTFAVQANIVPLKPSHNRWFDYNWKPHELSVSRCRKRLQIPQLPSGFLLALLPKPHLHPRLDNRALDPAILHCCDIKRRIRDKPDHGVGSVP